jgi:1-acyl-sn-glycerol-3-phosphate acyltransferase
VIVSNHSSFLDPSLCAIALNHVNFKCTFKHDLMFVPGVGSSLWFAGHIPVNRSAKEGMWGSKAAMETSARWAERGAPLLSYAEGTRKTCSETGERLGQFKPGPFVTAQKCGLPIVPVTLSGARALFPPGFRGLGFGEALITVHPPVAPPPQGDKEAVERVLQTVRNTVDSALRSPIDDLPPNAKDKEKTQ